MDVQCIMAVESKYHVVKVQSEVRVQTMQEWARTIAQVHSHLG
jgi:hypothetical protein